MHPNQWKPPPPGPPNAYGQPGLPPGYPAAPVYGPPPAPRRSAGFWLLAVGLPVGAIILAVGLSIALVFYEKEEPATAAEQELVLRKSDLEQYVEPEEAWYETAIRRKSIDRSYVIEYTFESDSYYVLSLFYQLRNSADARATYRAAVVESRRGARDGGMTLQAADDLMKWGDECACFILLRDGEPVGHSFTARKGDKVVDAWIIGAFIEDKWSFRGMMLPVLQRVDAR